MGEKFMVVGIFNLVLFIMLFIMIYVNKFSNEGIFWGIRVPKAYKDDKEIKRLNKGYKILTIMVCIITLLVFNLFAFITFKMYLMLICLFVAIFTMNIPFVFYWNKMKELKEEKGWKTISKNIVVVDTSLRKKKLEGKSNPLGRKYFLWLFIIPFITLIVTTISYKNLPESFPVHFNGWGVADRFALKGTLSGTIELYLPVVMQFAMVGFFIGMNKIVINSKSDLSSGGIKSTVEKKKLFKAFNSRLMFVMALETILLFSLIQFSILFGWNVGILSMVGVAIILLTVVAYSILSFFIGQGGRNIPIEDEGEEFYRDDDKYWLLGNFYCNKKDPAIFVEKRVGVGYEINIGHPVGVFIMIATILLIIGAIVYMAILES